MLSLLLEHFRILQKHFLYSLLPTHGIDFNKNILKKQEGGTVDYKPYTYENNTFTIKIDDDDPNEINISIVSTDGTDCVTVFVHRKLRLAIINNMSYYENCSKEGLKYPGGGTTLFKLILAFLKKNKEKYKIKRIILADHSFLSCSKKNDNRLNLAQFKMITDGRTWYMKYGFLPYDAFKGKPSANGLLFLKHNIKVLETLKTSSMKIMESASKLKNIDKNELQRLINKYPLLKDFVKRLSTDLEKYCILIEAILDNAYKMYGAGGQTLHDFYNTQFYLDI